jgi:porin
MYVNFPEIMLKKWVDFRFVNITTALISISAVFIFGIDVASAQDAESSKAFQGSVQIKADGVGVVSGGDDRDFKQVTTVNFSGDLDLQSALGWTGLTAHADILVNLGQEPNDLVGAIQGVDNAAAGPKRPRLFQAWVEAAPSETFNVRVGFSDFNSEFDVADAAGLLMGPGYGIGNELSGTGVAGPSIYPSTAFGVRLHGAPSENTYWQATVMNAHAAVVGDRGGPDFSFDDGVLAAGEVGWTGKGKLALGAWTYSKRWDDIRLTDATGAPLRQHSRGVYAVVEQPFSEALSGFAKVGVADGRTTDVAASWQAGLLLSPALGARPDSAASVGVSQVVISSRARANSLAAGEPLSRTETQFELTYSDKLSEHLAIQPDIQYIRRPGGRFSVKSALVVSLRLIAEF